MTAMPQGGERDGRSQASFGAPGIGAPPPQAVEDAMCELERSRCALHAQFLALVGHFIDTEDYRVDGARDMGEWVARRFEMAPYQARETARVAEALRSLPRIAAAYGEGELSWDQLRVLTRYATPETDETLAEEARGLSLAGIERAARKARRKGTDEARRDQADNWVVKTRSVLTHCLQEVLEIGGVPVGIGMMSRTVPPRLLRLLQERDRGCRFPGCSRRRWVHAHHIWHWGKGGPTDLGNLVLLCSYHHTFVHEEGWSIRGNPMGELEFVRPGGDILPAGLAA